MMKAIPDNLYVILTMRTMQNTNKPDYAFLRRFYIERLKANAGDLARILNYFVRINSATVVDATKTKEQVDEIIGVPGKKGFYDYYNDIAKDVMYEFKDVVEDFLRFFVLADLPSAKNK